MFVLTISSSKCNFDWKRTGFLRFLHSILSILISSDVKRQKTPPGESQDQNQVGNGQTSSLVRGTKNSQCFVTILVSWNNEIKEFMTLHVHGDSQGHGNYE